MNKLIKPMEYRGYILDRSVHQYPNGKYWARGYIKGVEKNNVSEYTLPCKSEGEALQKVTLKLVAIVNNLE